MPTIRSSLAQNTISQFDRASLLRSGATKTSATLPTSGAQQLSNVTPLGGNAPTRTFAPATYTPGSGLQQTAAPATLNKGHVYTPAEKLAIQHIRPAQDQINEQLQRPDLSENTRTELWELKRWFERGARDAAVQANQSGEAGLPNLDASLKDLTAEFNRRLRELTRPVQSDSPSTSSQI